MYKVFCDNQMIVDSRIDDLAIITPVVDIGVNMAGSFSFTFPKTHPKIDSVNRLTSVIRVERDDEIVFQGFCSSDGLDMFGNRRITCDGDLAYLNDSILRPARYQGETVLSLLTKYINQHNAQVEERKRFEIGIVTVQDPNDYIYCYTNMNNTLSQIKTDLLDDLGGYIRVRYENGHRYIDYLAEATRNAEQTIELGKNLIDYNSNIDSNNLATRVIPLGALLENQVIEGLDTRLDIKSVNSGVDYLESASAVANFGIITKTVVFNDVNTASILKTKGQAWLNDNQFENIVISATALDLGIVTDRVDTFKLMDRVHIISDIHGMDRWFMLPRITLNLSSPENDVYTFGTTQRVSLTSKTTKTDATTQKIVESVDEDNWLTKAKNEAQGLVSGAEGGFVVLNFDEYGKPFELLVMDTDDISTATKVWRWNQNGLLYSEGYDATPKIAMTMNGVINADFIKAGVLTGREINNGEGTFLVTSAGEMVAKNVSITGGNINMVGNTQVSQNIKIHYTRPQDNKEFETYMTASGVYARGYDMFATVADGSVEGGLDEGAGGGFETTFRLYHDKTDRKSHLSVDVLDSIPVVSGYGPLMVGYNGHMYYVEWTGSALQFIVDVTVVWSTSDKRLKKNIKPLEDAYIDAIGSVPLIQYNQNRELYDDKILYFGAIAQDVSKALEDNGVSEDNLKVIKKDKISTKDDTEYYGLDYEQFLLARIAYDEKRIADLEKRLADLEGRIK